MIVFCRDAAVHDLADFETVAQLAGTAISASGGTVEFHDAPHGNRPLCRRRLSA